MNPLPLEVQRELFLSAERRNDALTAVGFPDSPLWLSLQAPECAYCGTFIRRGAVKRGNCWKCAACIAVEEPDESWRSEEAERRRNEYYAVMGWR